MEDYFKDKKGFWWMLLSEITYMFSNKQGLFSSKRVERFVMFTIAMWLIVGYVIRKWNELSVDNVLMLGGFLLGFGAWNAVQLRKDKQAENERNENAPNPNNVS